MLDYKGDTEKDAMNLKNMPEYQSVKESNAKMDLQISCIVVVS